MDLMICRRTESNIFLKQEARLDAPQPILRYCLTNNLRGPLRRPGVTAVFRRFATQIPNLSDQHLSLDAVEQAYQKACPGGQRLMDAQRCQNHGPVRLLVSLLEFNHLEIYSSSVA